MKIVGALTKGSAVYCPRLVRGLGEMFERHLNHGQKLEKAFDLKTEGLESPLVNDIAKNAEWAVGAAWPWSGIRYAYQYF